MPNRTRACAVVHAINCLTLPMEFQPTHALTMEQTIECHSCIPCFTIACLYRVVFHTHVCSLNERESKWESETNGYVAYSSAPFLNLDYESMQRGMRPATKHPRSFHFLLSILRRACNSVCVSRASFFPALAGVACPTHQVRTHGAFVCHRLFQHDST